MRSEVLFEKGGHRWLVIGRDARKREDIIDTNQFAIQSSKGTLILDPGGIEIFPRVLSILNQHVRVEEIKAIFSSHQDPDIISSLAMWLDLCPDVKIYSSWLWTGFISHFRMGSAVSFQSIPDEGLDFAIAPGGPHVQAVPAHYCHSPGNFGVYDPAAKILFSGDIGAALLPGNDCPLFVEDFDEHIQFMNGFHLRWMPANHPLRSWVARARLLDIDMICPQHGSLFRGENVHRFLDWLEGLDVESLDPMAMPESAQKEVLQES